MYYKCYGATGLSLLMKKYDFIFLARFLELVVRAMSCLKCNLHDITLDTSCSWSIANQVSMPAHFIPQLSL